VNDSDMGFRYLKRAAIISLDQNGELSDEHYIGLVVLAYGERKS